MLFFVVLAFVGLGAVTLSAVVVLSSRPAIAFFVSFRRGRFSRFPVFFVLTN